MGTIDKHLLLGEDQGAITASAATTNLKDFGAANPDRGDGQPVYLRATVQTAAGGTGSITVKIQDCDTEGGTYVDIAASKDYAISELVSGAVIKVPFPPKHRRFVRGYFTVTGTVSAVTFTTDITAG